MYSTGDPTREIYEKRDDAEAVQAFLALRDEAAKARKAQPEIYKRMYEKKTAAETNTGSTPREERLKNMTPEERARAEARAKKRQVRKNANDTKS